MWGGGEGIRERGKGGWRVYVPSGAAVWLMGRGLDGTSVWVCGMVLEMVL